MIDDKLSELLKLYLNDDLDKFKEQVEERVKTFKHHHFEWVTYGRNTPTIRIFFESEEDKDTFFYEIYENRILSTRYELKSHSNNLAKNGVMAYYDYIVNHRSFMSLVNDKVKGGYGRTFLINFHDKAKCYFTGKEEPCLEFDSSDGEYSNLIIGITAMQTIIDTLKGETK